MSISSVSFGHGAHATAAARKSALQQRSTDFSSLAQALSSNNLSGAKSALATLQKDVEKVAATQGSSRSTAVQQVKTDAQNLAAALSANNLTAAQKAFAALKRDSAGSEISSQHAHHVRHSGVASVASTAVHTNTMGHAKLSGMSNDLRAAEALSSVGSTLNVTV